MNLITNWSIDKATLIVSNIPGPKEPMVFNGVRTRELIGLIPGSGDLAFGISAISMG